jgi:FkbH-like protein
MSSHSDAGGLLAITATFTAEAVRDTLAFWMRELRFDYDIRFAPYNQVIQQLLDPGSLLAKNRNGVNVVLVRLEDWARTRDASGFNLETLEENVRHLVSCLRWASEGFGSPILMCICPASAGFLADPERAAFLAQMERFVQSEMHGAGTVHFATMAELRNLYPVADWNDPHADELGHLPYTPEFFTALGSLLARKIHAMQMTPYKVIALDCDDTLWQGICGEDGPSGVVLDEPRRALQEFMLSQHDAGMLLCLCSKNNEADVVETFRVHREMPLHLEHFVARRVNWEAKSTGLAGLATELDLDLGSFIFVDDNLQECGEVQADQPEVLALPLPAPAAGIPDFLKHVWAFDRLRITDEDRRRTALYGQQIQRARLEKEASTLEEFVAGLRLDVRITPMLPEQLARVAQLTQRTNQMNFTTIRRSENQIQAFLQSGGECLTVHVSDRFGSYGLTGVVMFEASPEAIRVDTFLLSCRVLGRGVEHRVVARLGEIGEQRGIARIELPFTPTERNLPVQQFLRSAGFQPASVVEVATDYAKSITYKPETTVTKPVTSATKSIRPEPIDFVRIATTLRDVQQIHQQVRSRQPLPTSVSDTAPRTQLEQQLADIWGELLGVSSIGVDDNFFDLGGHSLLAVQLLSRVRQALNVDVGLEVVYSSAFTIAELAKAIELKEIEQAEPEQFAQLLQEIENLSDDEVKSLLSSDML